VFNGHAIECRINAEDWTNDFQPSPGRITQAQFPAGSGIRIDTHIQRDVVIPPFYDSLLAKLIVHGTDRDDAIQRMQRALNNCRIEGISTNLPMHRTLLMEADFVRGGVDTAYFPQFLQRATQEVAHG
jgi:acetyl-CoA carboxylase biotin carboxylase subunit